MNVKRTPAENGKVKLVITADPSETDKAFTAGIALMLDQAGVPADPEKATPYEAMSKLFGSQEQIDQATIGAVVNYLLPFALDSEKITLVTSPDYDPSKLGVPQQGMPYAFEVTVQPKPEFELDSYDPVEVTVTRRHVTDQEIDQQLKMMADQAATPHMDIMTGEQTRMAPKIDDAWVKENIPDDACNTVAELRDRLREAGERYMNDQLEQDKMNQAVMAMTRNFTAQIPDDIVASTKHDFIESFKAQLAAQGKKLEDVLEQEGATEDQFEYDMETQARSMLTQGFTLDAVFRHAGLEVDDDDMKEAIRSMAGDNAEEAERQLRETGRLFAVTEAAERLKAGKHILDQAKITVTE